MPLPIIGGAVTAFKLASTGRKIGMAALAILAIVAAVVIWIKVMDDRHENTIEVAKEAGAAEAISAGQDLTLENIGKANDAESKTRGNIDNARYHECLRGTRTPGNCERYRTDGPVPD